MINIILHLLILIKNLVKNVKIMILFLDFSGYLYEPNDIYACNGTEDINKSSGKIMLIKRGYCTYTKKIAYVKNNIINRQKNIMHLVLLYL